MNQSHQIILAIVRHILGFVGAVLVAKGIITDELNQAWLTEAAAATTGVLLTLGAVLWSAVNKSNLRKRIDAALYMDPPATTEEIKEEASK